MHLQGRPVGPPPNPGELARAWRDAEDANPDRIERDFAARQFAKIAATLQLSDEELADLARRAGQEAEGRLAVLRAAGSPHITKQWVTRIPGEPPDEFYRRVGDTYLELRTRSDRPVQALRELADITATRAGNYVIRARQRGFIPPEGE